MRWRTAASLKIYARTNPRDYAARVRRMSQTDVDSTISAHLPSICDSELHASMGPVVGALTSDTAIADTCDVYVSEDEDENDGDEPKPANNPAAPSAVVDRGASRGAAAAPSPKRRAVADFGISLKQSNSKLPGSKSHARYEVYKVAATRAQFRALGGSAADYLGTPTTSARATSSCSRRERAMNPIERGQQ